MDKFEINSRIKEVRKYLDLTQDEFGERIGVSRNVIVNIELNRVEAKPLLINQICSEYGINKQWLCDGEGEMLDQSLTSSEDKLISLFTMLIKNNERSFKREFIIAVTTALGKLDANAWNVIQEMVDDLNEINERINRKDDQ